MFPDPEVMKKSGYEHAEKKVHDLSITAPMVWYDACFSRRATCKDIVSYQMQ